MSILRPQTPPLGAMSDSNSTEEPANATIPQQDVGPKERSKYDKNYDLNMETVSLYKKKDIVYLIGVRGVDPKPYKIYQVLGDASYKLSRDGKCDGKVYKQEDLQTVP